MVRYTPMVTTGNAISTADSTAKNQETIVTGKVCGCAKLNLRNEPSTDSEILCELDFQEELVIDEDNSTEEFFKVCTATGVEGFCMRQFITGEL